MQTPELNRRTLLAGLGATIALAGDGAARAAQSSLQSLYDQFVADGRIAGAVAALGRRGEPPVFIRAGRHAMGAGPAMGPQSLFRLYSMTKPLTGVLTMKLIEEGKLGLDQPIADFAPEFSAPRVLVSAESLETRPAVRPITVRHLLTHTSGLIYNFNESGPPILRDFYQKQGLTPGARGLSAPRAGDLAEPASLDEFAARLSKAPLAADPGVDWRYGVSTDLLGLILQRASGRSFEAALRERLLDPLEMADTDWIAPAAKLDRLTTNYGVPADGPVRALDAPPASVYAHAPPFAAGGAGLVSSAADYARFCAMMLNEGRLGGRRILRSNTMRLARSNLLPEGVSGEGGQHFGAAMQIARAGAQKPAPGRAPGAFGWGGAAGTDMWVDPTRGIYFVHMVQIMPFGSYDLWSQASQAAAAFDFPKRRP